MTADQLEDLGAIIKDCDDWKRRVLALEEEVKRLTELAVTEYDRGYQKGYTSGYEENF